MLLISAMVWLPVWQDEADVAHPGWIADPLLGAGCYALVFLRRRWPVPVAVAVALAGCVSGVAAGPAVLRRRVGRDPSPLAGDRRGRRGQLRGGQTSAADRRRHRPVVGDDPGQRAGDRRDPGWGMYIGSRRELI